MKWRENKEKKKVRYIKLKKRSSKLMMYIKMKCKMKLCMLEKWREEKEEKGRSEKNCV
jgi:hypothetical protein